MPTYPYTPSQLADASAADLLTAIKSPALLGRRLEEILSAQQFIGNFLLSGRYAIQGGAIAVPTNEEIRTQRRAETVNAGAEYKLTTLNSDQLEIYTSQKRGIATEVTDEEVTRSLRQPIDDALLFLKTELLFDANDIALGVINSSVTQTITGESWTTGADRGKVILRDVLKAKSAVRKLKLGFNLNTVVLNGDLYAEVLPELLDLYSDSEANKIVEGTAAPRVGGFTWVESEDDNFTDPLVVDRQRLGGIAREHIISPEYYEVGNDTGVQLASIREPKADKTRLQARNPHVPVVRNPLAGIKITGVA